MISKYNEKDCLVYNCIRFKYSKYIAIVEMGDGGRIHDDVIKWKYFPRNWPVPGEFPTQRPVTRSFDVFFDLCLNKRLSKQSWGWWFETQSCPLWRHRNALLYCTWHRGAINWNYETCVSHSAYFKKWQLIVSEAILSSEQILLNSFGDMWWRNNDAHGKLRLAWRVSSRHWSAGLEIPEEDRDDQVSLDCARCCW